MAKLRVRNPQYKNRRGGSYPLAGDSVTWSLGAQLHGKDGRHPSNSFRDFTEQLDHHVRPFEHLLLKAMFGFYPNCSSCSCPTYTAEQRVDRITIEVL